MIYKTDETGVKGREKDYEYENVERFFKQLEIKNSARNTIWVNVETSPSLPAFFYILFFRFVA